ncbi:MAG: twin-arginine translocase TatA/TatE family subunit [Desulfovibrio sp.]|nr:twin-arginine translocase TatA/TatE family subunit [Desulfovibrio sp.]
MGIGWQELLVVFVVIFIIFGARKLPEIGSGLGRAIRNFRSAMSEPDNVEVTSSKTKTSDNELGGKV